MELTPNYQFPAPEENDTGATALWMEAFARAVDEKANAYKQAFEDFAKPPMIVTTNLSTSASVPFNTGEQPVLNELWTYTGSQIIYSNVPNPGFGAGDLPRPGWWAFGVCRASSTLSAAADNSNWPLILEVTSRNIAPGQDVPLARESMVYMDSNTAGEHWQMSGTVYVPPGVSADVSLKIVNNTSVTRTFLVGAVGFRYYLGSGDIAQRAGF